MPTTRKPHIFGRAGGQRKRSVTFTKRKGPDNLGPGLPEAERLMGLQKARELANKDLAAQVEIMRRTAVEDKKKAAVALAQKALSNPRPLPKRKRAAYAPMFGYRVVRRYDKFGNIWLDVADVFYDKGKPYSFCLTPATLTAQMANSILDLDDAQALAVLRQRHEMMLAALSQPILDEKLDFSR